MPVGTTLNILVLYCLTGLSFWFMSKPENEVFNSRKAAIVALLSPTWPVAVLLLIIWGLWWLLKNIPVIFTAVTAEFKSLYRTAMNKQVDNK